MITEEDLNSKLAESFRDGFDKGRDSLARRIEELLGDPRITIYSLTDKIREVINEKEYFN